MQEIVIKTENIPDYRARRIGMAFSCAFRAFVKDPENANWIAERAREIAEKEKKEEEDKKDGIFVHNFYDITDSDHLDYDF